jgi:small subunit ribosomal protein S17
VNERRRVLKENEGTVVSDKMDKTVLVEVSRLKRHPLYGKVVRHTKRYMAHDENNQCQVGDKVLIRESRPLSCRKRWRVVRVVEKVQ